MFIIQLCLIQHLHHVHDAPYFDLGGYARFKTCIYYIAFSRKETWIVLVQCFSFAMNKCWLFNVKVLLSPQQSSSRCAGIALLCFISKYVRARPFRRICSKSTCFSAVIFHFPEAYLRMSCTSISHLLHFSPFSKHPREMMKCRLATTEGGVQRKTTTCLLEVERSAAAAKIWMKSLISIGWNGSGEVREPFCFSFWSGSWLNSTGAMNKTFTTVRRGILARRPAGQL